MKVFMVIDFYGFSNIPNHSPNVKRAHDHSRRINTPYSLNTLGPKCCAYQWFGRAVLIASLNYPWRIKQLPKIITNLDTELSLEATLDLAQLAYSLAMILIMARYLSLATGLSARKLSNSCLINDAA